MPTRERITERRWTDTGSAASDLVRPRDDLVLERRVDEPDGDSFPAHFVQTEGPFTVWERSVHRDGDDLVETTRHRVEVPWFGWLYAIPIAALVARRRHAPGSGRPIRITRQWWAPPDRLAPRQVRVLGLLAAAAMSSAFVNTLFTQTVTFAADDFGVGNREIGIAGAMVRLGILITIPLAVLADRIGRRRVIVGLAWSAPLVSSLGALAPTFPLLVATQTIGRPLGLGLDFLIAVVAAEEMPRNSRAHAVGVLAMASGLGAGIAVMALPLTDLAAGGWRLVYLLGVIWLVVAVDLTRRLPETQRFATAHREHVRIDRRRFALLAAIAVGVNLFVAPASFFQNRYLDEVRGLSGSWIAAFTLGTSTPAAIGLIVGGQLADRGGRRRLIGVALPAATALILLSFTVGGPVMWLAAFAGGVAGGMSYPALAVYRAELFPTGNRSRAAGLLTVAALLGGVIGLLVAGWMLDGGRSYGAVLGMLAMGQLLAVAIVLGFLPETAHRELEELNPDG
ncbi:MAG: MFS transporter [Ilumatobacteraceae bacterium]